MSEIRIPLALVIDEDRLRKAFDANSHLRGSYESYRDDWVELVLDEIVGKSYWYRVERAEGAQPDNDEDEF